MNRHSAQHVFCFVPLLLGVALLPGILRGADSKDADKKGDLKPAGQISGLMIDFKSDYMLVQLDDRDEPTKFLFGPGVTIPVLTKHGIFPCNRITLKYKSDGDDKKVVDAVKLPGRQAGIVVGKVIKVYNDFWVSVKPKEGMIEGFALGGNNKAAADTLKSLKPGDLVAIKYATDFERHRIQQIDVRPAATK